MYLKGLRTTCSAARWSFCEASRRRSASVRKLVAPWLTTGTPTVPVQSRELRDDAYTLGEAGRASSG